MKVQEKAEPPLEEEQARVSEQIATGPADSASRTRPLIYVAGLVTAWRIVVHFLGIASNSVLAPLAFADQARPRTGLEIWWRWDATFFFSIAEHGYADPSWPAFFPMYPLAIRVVRTLAFNQISFHTAALVASFLILVAGLVLFYRLGAHLFPDDGESSAKRAVFYLLAFPTSIFLAVAYSESLYLLTTVGAFYAAEKRKWWLAGVVGMLAAATRLTGIVLLPALGVLYLEQHGWRLRRPRSTSSRSLGRSWVWLGLIPAGVLGYFLYLEAIGRGFFGYFHALRIGWAARQFSPNVVKTAFAYIIPFVRREHPWGGLTVVLDFLAIAGVVVALVFMWRRIPKAYSVYSVLVLSLVLSSSIPVGAARYTLGIFPLFLLLGRLGRSARFDRAYVLLTVPLMGLAAAMWTIGYWLG